MAKTGEVTQQAVTRSELDLRERGITRSMSGRRGMLRRCEDVVDVLLEDVCCLKISLWSGGHVGARLRKGARAKAVFECALYKLCFGSVHYLVGAISGDDKYPLPFVVDRHSYDTRR